MDDETRIIKDIIVLRVQDAEGVQVAAIGDISGLPNVFQENFEKNFSESGMRNIYRHTENGSVWLVVPEKSERFQGSKHISFACGIFLSLIPVFKQAEKKHRQHFDSIITRFSHNLVKFQRRFKDTFNFLAPDSARARPFVEFQDEVKKRIEENINKASSDVCHMAQRASDIDAQITILRIVSGYADSSIQIHKQKINLNKALYRLTNPFLRELNARNVSVKIKISEETGSLLKVSAVPEFFNVAIWQLFDNASKYVLNDTDINISAVLSAVPPRLEISMVSVCIDNDEKEKIFFEGYKGKYSGKKGQNGIGLYIVQKALKLMESKIFMQNDGDVCCVDGYKYCKNCFVIEFCG